MWLLVHYDGAIIGAYKGITNDDQLQSVLESGKQVFTKVDKAYLQYSSSKDPQDILTYAQSISKTYDFKKAAKLANEYVKQVDPSKIDDESLQSVIRICAHIIPSKRIYKLLKSEGVRAKKLVRRDTVLDMQQAYILKGLKGKGLLEPYYVWESYEKELGADADSLYRLFALSYLSSSSSDKEMLYYEAYEYLAFYADSPWDYLKVLYSIVVPAVSKKEEMEELLELISYQISRDSNYRALDFKAYLLYKLGNKEKALSMVGEIISSAKEKGVKYESLLKSIQK